MDELFLLKPGFQDPDLPGRVFYCWHCALIEGVLLSSPELAKNIIVTRIDWPRPREKVIAIAGPENQSLPLIVLVEGNTTRYQTSNYLGRAIIQDKDLILRYLSEQYGFPEQY